MTDVWWEEGCYLMAAAFNKICVNQDPAVGDIHHGNYLCSLKVWRFFWDFFELKITFW
jgi:hypothetical protein